MLSEKELWAIMPNHPKKSFLGHLSGLNTAMLRYGISNNVYREAAFLANVAEETGEGKWTHELASGKEYEGRKDLGNVQKGDGVLFKGRGDFQLTGRANYEHYGKVLHLPLLENPDIASEPAYSALIAALYWQEHGCNDLADQKKFVAIVRRINGGTNGLSARLAYYSKALKVLSRNDSAKVETDEKDDTTASVTLDGNIVSLAGDKTPAYMETDGRLWCPLRPLADMLNLEIGSVEAGLAVLLREEHNSAVPISIKTSVGYSPVRPVADFAGYEVKCDPGKAAASLVRKFSGPPIR